MDSNEITRKYFDSILLKSRLIDSDFPDISFDLWGKRFNTPITTAALSHINGTCENGMTELAKGAKEAGAVNFVGMESYEGELDDLITAQADTIKIIKPLSDNNEIYKRIEHANELGVFAMGMDIDHAFGPTGNYDVVEGLSMRPKTKEELKSFVQKAGDTPFVIKGVLSVEDARKCVEIGAKGIIVSHHHGIMPSSVPPLMILPQIKEAVGDALTIFVDCGIESGIDVFKALCLGADAVCVGRALIPALKEGKASGVAKKLKSMSGELSSIMARTGYHSLKELDDSSLVINEGFLR